MDEQLTDGYTEPCGQCAAVNWGVSDGGQFFCKSCHNVIEKTKEVEDNATFHLVTSRISNIAKSKNAEKAIEWMVCEGFQFILKEQAEALVRLGVCSQFKTDVLWNFWKRYLRNTRQAFVKKPINTAKLSVDLGSESETESVARNEQTNDEASLEAQELNTEGCHSDKPPSAVSGSVDASFYIKKKSQSRNLMTMPRTLALCYLALLWVREAITLADLLRLVSERRVPYINVHEDFPEQMKVFGMDAIIFQVRSIPSYSKVNTEAVELARVMKLPSFPAVSQDCLLHPNLLTVRYLLEFNLPDSLHIWVHKVIDQAAIGDDFFLTFDPARKNPHLLCYDIQAVAVIIVTMKLLFKLNDKVEWTLPQKTANEEKKKKKVFSLRRWFNVMQPAFEKGRQKKERYEARQQWKSKKPLISDMKGEKVALKKKRVAEHLQHLFQKLTDSTPEQQTSTTACYSSFHFHWGKEEGSDGPSMHHHRLDCTFKKRDVKRLTNRKYWHPDLKPCPPDRCGDHFSDFEPSLPRMYVWLLDLFSFLLGVSQAQVHKEVLVIERRFLKRKSKSATEMTSPPPKKKKIKNT